MDTNWKNDPMKQCALVMLFPENELTMWSSEINELVTEVEERVDGTFVTTALLNGRQPSLVDAMMAVRFMGCSSAVVAVLGASGSSTEADVPVSGGSFPISLVACRPDPAAVVDAYLSQLFAEPLACA
jgi:hypothetical protein